MIIGKCKECDYENYIDNLEVEFITDEIFIDNDDLIMQTGFEELYHKKCICGSYNLMFICK